MTADLRKALPLFLIWPFLLFLNFCVKTNLKIASLALKVSQNKVLLMTDEKKIFHLSLHCKIKEYRIYIKSWISNKPTELPVWWMAQDHALSVR